MHDDGIAEPRLPELVEYLHELHPSLTVELFVRGDDDVRSRVLDTEGELQTPPLSEGSTYHSPTVFQFNADALSRGDYNLSRGRTVESRSGGSHPD